MIADSTQVGSLRNKWLTAYADVAGGTRVTTTYPEGPYNVQRDFDRLGRPVEIDYGDADITPRVGFEYNTAGNRAVMREYDESEQIRKTSYEYDTTRRLASVNFDTDGDDDTDETVSYEYDLSGNRTKLTFPGDLSITYAYNGDGNRIQQDALKYILDLQPGLSQMLGDSDGNRYVHGPRGIHAVSDGADWTYPITDALGSVRAYADGSNNILSTVNYSEWGVPSAA